jgi:vacuolar iron transporter family protein
VLRANDGILSTASLIVGVAAAAATQHDVLVAGVAGLVACGRYVGGRRRVCVRQLAIRHRTGESRARAQGTDPAILNLSSMS